MDLTEVRIGLGNSISHTHTSLFGGVGIRGRVKMLQACQCSVPWNSQILEWCMKLRGMGDEGIQNVEQLYEIQSTRTTYSLRFPEKNETLVNFISKWFPSYVYVSEKRDARAKETNERKEMQLGQRFHSAVFWLALYLVQSLNNQVNRRHWK